MERLIMVNKQKWDVFISHASEDKPEFVKPLAVLLSRSGVEVWYDEFSLEEGDSLTRSIDKGLANSKFGVLIISKAFIKKKWPEYEMRGLVGKLGENSDKGLSGQYLRPNFHPIYQKERCTMKAYSQDVRLCA